MHMRLSGCQHGLVKVPAMRLHGRRLSEGLMRPASVVEALEPGQLDVQGARRRIIRASTKPRWPPDSLICTEPVHYVGMRIDCLELFARILSISSPEKLAINIETAPYRVKQLAHRSEKIQICARRIAKFN